MSVPHVDTVDNPAHCDFIKLRDVLLKYGPRLMALELKWSPALNGGPCACMGGRTHVDDLKEVTEDTLYEHFREHDLVKKGAGTYVTCLSFSGTT